MTKYNSNKKTLHNKGWEQYKDRMIYEEKEFLRDLADHLDEDPNADDLAERLGFGKTIEEKYVESEILRQGWVTRKTKKGNIFISVGDVKPHSQKSKGKKYDFGRIQVTVDPEWVGYTAIIVVSKIETPKFKTYTDEIKLGDLKDKDPSDLADIVIESKEKSNSSESKLKRDLPEWALDELD